jgi:hypothetical protein
MDEGLVLEPTKNLGFNYVRSRLIVYQVELRVIDDSKSLQLLL